MTYYKNKEKNSLRYFLLFLGTLYLGFSHYKGIMHLLITSSLSLGYNLKNIFCEDDNSIKISKKESFVYVSILLFMFLIISFNIKFQKEEDLSIYSVANVLDKEVSKNNLVKNDLDIYTGYKDGAYLEYPADETLSRVETEYVEETTEIILPIE